MNARRVATSGELVYAELDSPLGPMLAVAADEGVLWLGFEDEDPDAALARVEGRCRRSPRRLDGLRRQVNDYFEGRRRAFAIPVDLSPVPGFLREALHAARRIPYGTVATYGAVAAMAGRPRAARAAGTALARNPIALLIPCHRVVPAAGGLGRYGGREDRKAFLLRLEGVELAPGPPARDGRPGAAHHPGILGA